jgi:hypothetical protein
MIASAGGGAPIGRTRSAAAVRCAPLRTFWLGLHLILDAHSFGSMTPKLSAILNLLPTA